jgi:hypothetical protein
LLPVLLAEPIIVEDGLAVYATHSIATSNSYNSACRNFSVVSVEYIYHRGACIAAQCAAHVVPLLVRLSTHGYIVASRQRRGGPRTPAVELRAILAELYGADLWQIMYRAGWVPVQYEDDAPGPEPSAWDMLPQELFAGLTADEVDEVVEYVKLIKRRRHRRIIADAMERERAEVGEPTRDL